MGLAARHAAAVAADPMIDIGVVAASSPLPDDSSMGGLPLRGPALCARSRLAADLKLTNRMFRPCLTP